VLGGHRPAATVEGISQGGVSLKTTRIALPTEEPTLPGGAASEIITNNCTACHSVEMITMQPPLDAKTWGKEVAKMREVFHGAIDPKDDAAIVAALGKLPTQQAKAVEQAAKR